MIVHENAYTKSEIKQGNKFDNKNVYNPFLSINATAYIYLIKLLFSSFAIKYGKFGGGQTALRNSSHILTIPNSELSIKDHSEAKCKTLLRWNTVEGYLRFKAVWNQCHSVMLIWKRVCWCKIDSDCNSVCFHFLSSSVSYT